MSLRRFRGLLILFLLAEVIGCGSGKLDIHSNNEGTKGDPGSADSGSPNLVIQAPLSRLIGGQVIHLKAILSGAEVPVKWAATDPEKKAIDPITSDGRFTAPDVNGNVFITAKLLSDPKISATIAIDIVTATAEPGSIAFSYYLASPARTSAAAYDGAGHLLRTLWSNRQDTSGAHVGRWDGLNDDGAQPSKGSYTIKVLYNNVEYQWTVIGDTSRSLGSPNNWDAQASFPTDAALSQNTMVVTNGYAEGRNNAAAFELQDPQDRHWRAFEICDVGR
jgi:hypothetical protein